MMTETTEGFDISLYSNRTFTTLEKRYGWTLKQAVEIGSLMKDAYERGMSHGQTISYKEGWDDGYREGRRITR